MLPQLIVVATVEAASAILLEAALSFLGLGVQPPLPSWGLMIAEAKLYMFFSFWLIAIPGTALALLVLAINLVGDGIRDVTAPAGEPDVSAARASTGLSVDIATPRGTLHAVRDVSFRDRARRDAVPRRRVRLRQVDDRARADGPAAARRDAHGARARVRGRGPRPRAGRATVAACAATAWR